MATRFRICKNTGPFDPWWEVEVEREQASGHFWWKKTEMVWKPVLEINPGASASMSPSAWVRTKRFENQDDAQAYIDISKTERTHVCGEPQ